MGDAKKGPLWPRPEAIEEAIRKGKGGHPIEILEAAGQRLLVASDLLPCEGPWSDLEAFGFKAGAMVEGDPLFRHVELPAGWRREASEHAMTSYVLDPRGIRRLNVFYKAAPYDRRANFTVIHVGRDLVDRAMVERDPVLPPQWPLLTDMERLDLVAIANEWIAKAEKEPDFYVERGRRARVLVSRIDPEVVEAAAVVGRLREEEAIAISVLCEIARELRASSSHDGKRIIEHFRALVFALASPPAQLPDAVANLVQRRNFARAAINALKERLLDGAPAHEIANDVDELATALRQGKIPGPRGVTSQRAYIAPELEEELRARAQREGRDYTAVRDEFIARRFGPGVEMPASDFFGPDEPRVPNDAEWRLLASVRDSAAVRGGDFEPSGRTIDACVAEGWIVPISGVGEPVRLTALGERALAHAERLRLN